VLTVQIVTVTAISVFEIIEKMEEQPEPPVFSKQTEVPKKYEDKVFG
jgi:hypothetical protein